MAHYVASDRVLPEKRAPHSGLFPSAGEQVIPAPTPIVAWSVRHALILDVHRDSNSVASGGSNRLGSFGLLGRFRHLDTQMNQPQVAVLALRHRISSTNVHAAWWRAHVVLRRRLPREKFASIFDRSKLIFLMRPGAPSAAMLRAMGEKLITRFDDILLSGRISAFRSLEFYMVISDQQYELVGEDSKNIHKSPTAKFHAFSFRTVFGSRIHCSSSCCARGASRS